MDNRIAEVLALHLGSQVAPDVTPLHDLTTTAPIDCDPSCDAKLIGRNMKAAMDTRAAARGMLLTPSTSWQIGTWNKMLTRLGGRLTFALIATYSIDGARSARLLGFEHVYDHDVVNGTIVPPSDFMTERSPQHIHLHLTTLKLMFDRLRQLVAMLSQTQALDPSAFLELLREASEAPTSVFKWTDHSRQLFVAALRHDLARDSPDVHLLASRLGKAGACDEMIQTMPTDCAHVDLGTVASAHGDGTLLESYAVIEIFTHFTSGACDNLQLRQLFDFTVSALTRQDLADATAASLRRSRVVLAAALTKVDPAAAPVCNATNASACLEQIPTDPILGEVFCTACGVTIRELATEGIAEVSRAVAAQSSATRLASALESATRVTDQVLGPPLPTNEQLTAAIAALCAMVSDASSYVAEYVSENAVYLPILDSVESMRKTSATRIIRGTAQQCNVQRSKSSQKQCKAK